MSEYQVNSIIREGKRTFRVLKVNKFTARVREVFITKKRTSISERMGDFFEIKLPKEQTK